MRRLVALALAWLAMGFMGVGAAAGAETQTNARSLRATLTEYEYERVTRMVQDQGVVVQSSAGDRTVGLVGSLGARARTANVNGTLADAGLGNREGCGTYGLDFPVNGVAIVYRGGCTFADKASRAIEAGARGMIVVSNTTYVFGMQGSASGTSSLLAVLVTRAAGEAFSASLTQARTSGRRITVSMLPFAVVGRTNSSTPRGPPSTKGGASPYGATATAARYASLGYAFLGSAAAVSLYWIARFAYIQSLRRKRRGALRQLKKSKYDAAVMTAFNNGTCSVCLDDFTPQDDVLVMPPCRHVFHERCVMEWLSNASTCPNCKVELLPPARPGESSTSAHAAVTNSNGNGNGAHANADVEMPATCLGRVFGVQRQSALVMSFVVVFSVVLFTSFLALAGYI